MMDHRFIIIYFKDIILSRSDILLVNLLKYHGSADIYADDFVVVNLRLFEIGVILEAIYKDKISREKFLGMIKGFDIRGIEEHIISGQWMRDFHETKSI